MRPYIEINIAYRGHLDLQNSLFTFSLDLVLIELLASEANPRG